MDASMMAAMGGSGMDMSSSGIFRPDNQSLARTYWYLIAACTFSAYGFKALQAINSESRKRVCRTLSLSHPTRPRSIVSQAYATTIAICRELSYPPVVHFSKPWLEWLSPPPLGRSLAIVTYWAIITLFLTTGSIIHDAYYWERIGFRAAWVSVTQVPLIYLFAGKVNIIGTLFGSSYMDLNWIHRWVARTLLITVTVHGGFFVREWVRADFFQAELDLMPMVKWGIAAWGVLVWTTISSFLPIRRLCYELFVLQHLATAGVFLWLLYKHVPSYAAYNVWMAVAFAVSGRLLRSCIFTFRNFSFRASGHCAELEVLPGDITVLTIRDVRISWRPGQYVQLWCPTLGPLESHPFTIANTRIQDDREGASQIQLVIRARSGFTRRLHRRATKDNSISAPILRAYITGPFGNLPSWNTFETLVLISASTGASFTLPILESVLNDPCCVSRIDCLFSVKEKSHLDAYLSRLKAAASHPRAAEIELRIRIAITGEKDKPCSNDNDVVESKSLSSSSTSSETPSKELPTTDPTNLPHSIPKSNNHPNPSIEKSPSYTTTTSLSPSSSPSPPSPITTTHLRTPLPPFIRAPIEASAGETCVVAVGGTSLTNDVRGIVGRLADERAVHKGTGAQGIALHVEGSGS